MKDTLYGITESEKAVASHCLKYAMKCGAYQVRISLSKSVLDTFMFLNGKLDKVTHCADRSIYIYLYIDGKYGTYSTNRLETSDIEDFIDKAIENTRMYAEDRFYKLPSPERTAKGAVSGREAGLYDEEYENMTAAKRLELAMSGTIFDTAESNGKYNLVSEECEYSDSIDDNYVIDSQGFEGRHTETSFAFWTEVTIEDSKGHKYSGYQWTSSPFFKDAEICGCGEKALERAVNQINPKHCKSGKMTMIVDNRSSSRLISPVLSALNAAALQQQSSFLIDSIGKKLFPEEFTLTDKALDFGKSGARLFDTEGVATCERDIIRNGVVSTYFVNTYFSGKMGIEPTIEGVSRPVVYPFVKGKDKCKAEGQQEMMELCKDGILVTGFNGGNCNPTTGNFSYGIEGFVFKNGKILHPVKEMVITGNMIALWGSLIAAGDDALAGTRWQIPTLAFENVDFSA